MVFVRSNNQREQVMEPRIKKIKPGGLFTPGEVEFHNVKYQVLDRTRGIIVCNNCQGGGQESNGYGGLKTCRFCDGQGTLRLKKPTKEI
jgi:hypothetical protein